jgi:peptide/nickel transport system substrate-binding protein
MWVKEVVIEELKKSENVKVSINESPRWVMRLFMNLSARGETSFGIPHPVFNDVRVRQAVRMAIDVDTITKEIFLGYAKPVWTEFFREPYQCDIPRPKFDPEAAKALLEEAGWKDTDGDGIRECHGCGTASDGYVMEFELGTYAEFGESMTLTQQLIAEQLRAIGMKTNITQTEGSVLWADSQSGGVEQSGNYDMDIWDDGYAGVDPTDFMWEFYSDEAAQPDYGYNFVRWYDQEFNDLLDLSYTLDESVGKIFSARWQRS